jgi:hypothetical protein
MLWNSKNCKKWWIEQKLISIKIIHKFMRRILRHQDTTVEALHQGWLITSLKFNKIFKINPLKDKARLCFKKLKDRSIKVKRYFSRTLKRPIQCKFVLKCQLGQEGHKIRRQLSFNNLASMKKILLIEVQLTLRVGDRLICLIATRSYTKMESKKLSTQSWYSKLLWSINTNHR